MALTIQERLKDLRVERGLTLEQLAEQTHLSKSALGSYEADEYKDISHYAIIKLAKFYGVTADYLLGLTESRRHPYNGWLGTLAVSPCYQTASQGALDFLFVQVTIALDALLMPLKGRSYYFDSVPLKGSSYSFTLNLSCMIS